MIIIIKYRVIFIEGIYHKHRNKQIFRRNSFEKQKFVSIRFCNFHYFHPFSPPFFTDTTISRRGMVNICTRKIFHRFQVNRIRSKAGSFGISPPFRIFIAKWKEIESNRTIGNHGNERIYLLRCGIWSRKGTRSKLKVRCVKRICNRVIPGRGVTLRIPTI